MDQVKIGSDKGDGALAGQLKRKYHREKVSGFVGNIADGQKIIDGIVENISTGGFQTSLILDDPRHIYAQCLVNLAW